MDKYSSEFRMGFRCLMVLFLVCSCASQQDRILFGNGGQDWLSSGDSEWKFHDGELVGFASNSDGFVMTEDVFGDFIVELEFFPDETVNSGVFTRCTDIALSASECYEFNIWDDHPNQESRTGAIVSRTAALSKVNTIDQWNTYKISCKKGKIKAWINGTLVADLENDDLTSGHIGLQAAGTGTIRFRNVRILELKE